MPTACRETGCARKDVLLRTGHPTNSFNHSDQPCQVSDASLSGVTVNDCHQKEGDAQTACLFAAINEKVQEEKRTKAAAEAARDTVSQSPAESSPALSKDQTG